MYHESITGNHFSLTVSPSQLQKNTIKTCEFVLSKFTARFSKPNLAGISQEVPDFGFIAFTTKE